MQLHTIEQIIKMLDHVASKDETRYHLGTVQIDKKYLTTTDGYILTRIEHNDIALAPLKTPVYIHRETLPTLKSFLKQRGSIWVTGTCVVTEELISFNGFRLTDPGGINYPDVTKVISKRLKDPVRVSFNAELILKLSKVINTHPHKAVILEINSKDSTAPIRVLNSSQDDGVLAVMMPMRVGGKS
jgi:hypothetical protein